MDDEVDVWEPSGSTCKAKKSRKEFLTIVLRPSYSPNLVVHFFWGVLVVPRHLERLFKHPILSATDMLPV